MNITRRNIIALSSAGALIAITGGMGHWTAGPRQNYIKAVVRDRLSYLTFSEATLNEFAQDFVAFTPAMNAPRGATVSWIGLHISRLGSHILGSELTQKLTTFEEKIASDFLKATDFFDEGRNTQRTLTYIAFPDPYLNTCRSVPAEFA